MSKNAVMPLDDYKNACDNIREKTETTETIKSGELPKKINEVYEAGQAQGEREMWDMVTANNTRSDYHLAFFQWGSEYIRPPYTLKPTAYYSLKQTFSEAKSLKKIEKHCFDFSNKEKRTGSSQYALYYTFDGCTNLEEIEDIGLPSDHSLTGTFSNCERLRKIEVIRVNEETTFLYGTFYYCQSLEYVRFEGVIGQNGIDLRWSTKLTQDSCHSIFTHLKDFREKIVENYSLPTDTQGFSFATYNLVQGQKYSGHYQNDAIGGCDFSGVAQYTEVPSVGQRLAVTFELVDPMGTPYNVFVYNENGSLCIFDTSNVSLERYITISTITETRTITMPTAVRDNGNAIPEDIAEATERGWTIVWS